MDATALMRIAEQLLREHRREVLECARDRELLVWREGPAHALPEVARTMHLSTRTLKRRLAEQGTTFSKIRDDLRRQRALLLVDNRALSIGEVATKLGYTELPNFTRAFRKWTGMTPLAYRTR